MAFEYLQGKKLQSLRGDCSSAQSPLQSECVFWCSDSISCFSCAIASSPGTGHHSKQLPLCNFTSSIYTQWWDPCWAFSSSGWTVPVFSAFSHRRDALVPLSFSWPFICPCLLYLAVQNLTQHSRNGPTGAEWSLLSALLLVQPRIPSAFAGSSSAWCPLGLFLPMCFLASQPPAFPGAWACSSLDAGLHTSPCWCAWASCQPSSSHSGSLWMAAQPPGVLGIPPSYMSSSALLRLWSPSSSRSLMKVLNRTGPCTDPWGALLPFALQLDFLSLVTCRGSLWLSVWWDIQVFLLSEIFFLTLLGYTRSSEINFNTFFLTVRLGNH